MSHATRSQEGSRSPSVGFHAADSWVFHLHVREDGDGRAGQNGSGRRLGRFLGRLEFPRFKLFMASFSSICFWLLILNLFLAPFPSNCFWPLWPQATSGSFSLKTVSGSFRRGNHRYRHADIILIIACVCWWTRVRWPAAGGPSWSSASEA